MREHLSTDNISHIFKHIQSLSSYRDACDEGYLKVLSSGSTYHSRKIKEALDVI